VGVKPDLRDCLASPKSINIFQVTDTIDTFCLYTNSGLPLSRNADSCKLGRLHVNLNPEIDMALFLKPEQANFSAQKFSAVGQN
jgi:hypothetical protein